MDCDPRDYDSRQDERFDPKGERTSRGGSYDRDLDDWRQPEMPARESDDEARELGRGPGDDSRQSNSDAQRHDPRNATRRPTRDRDPRDAFTRDLHLPRGREREIVRDRDREFTLRGSESRTLATVGAFRVVSSRDLRDHHDRPADPRSGDLRHDGDAHHERRFRVHSRVRRPIFLSTARGVVHARGSSGTPTSRRPRCSTPRCSQPGSLPPGCQSWIGLPSGSDSLAKRPFG
jgi:hypothetical protein